VKRVLVRAPKGKEQTVLVFPLVHLVRDNFGEETKIDIVCERDDAELYSMLDVEASIHVIPESKQTISGIHHYCYNNCDVFNVDLFLDLTDTFKGSFLGFCFRSKERVGYNRGLKSIFINRKKEDELLNSFSDRYIHLFKDYNKVDLNSYVITKKGNENNNVISMEISPYMLIITNGFFLNSLWKGFLEKLSGIKVIVWDQNESEARHLELVSMSLLPTLEISVDIRGSLTELVTLALFSKVVITDVDWAANFLSYKGSEVVLLKNSSEQFQTTRYYPNIPKTVLYKESVIEQMIAADVKSPVTNEQQLVDYIFASYF